MGVVIDNSKPISSIRKSNSQSQPNDHKAASRNLWIAIPSLLCGFVVWLNWCVATAKQYSFYEYPDKFTTLASVGLIAAALWLPSSFFIRLFGWRKTLVFTLLVGSVFSTYLWNMSVPLWGSKLILLAILSFASCCFWFGWFGINNLRAGGSGSDQGSLLGAMLKMSLMLGVGLLTAFIGLWLLLPEDTSWFEWRKVPDLWRPSGTPFNGSGWRVPKEIVLALVITTIVFGLKLLLGKTKTNLQHQYRIFNNRHTWIMSVIYIMTFGSFIGLAAAFPMILKVIFAFDHVMINFKLSHIYNYNFNVLKYAVMGPFIGALARPVGAWISGRIGGAVVTQICAAVMMVSALGVAYYMKEVYRGRPPEEVFQPFLLLFLSLFAATGIGIGAAFRTITVIFSKEQSSSVLGWSSAIAAFCAFYIPMSFGEQLKSNSPEYLLVGLAFFYLICLVINYWFYLRKSGEFYNP